MLCLKRLSARVKTREEEVHTLSNIRAKGDEEIPVRTSVDSESMRGLASRFRSHLKFLSETIELSFDQDSRRCGSLSSQGLQDYAVWLFGAGFLWTKSLMHFKVTV